MQTIPIVLQELDERAFLFVVEAGTDDCSLAFIRESKIDPFSFFSRPHRGCSRSFIRRDREVFVHQLAIDLCGKGYRGPDSESCLNGTPKAFCGALKVSTHGDDPLRSWHFEYHIRVVRNSHEFCQSWSSNDGVVPAIEARHLKPQELSSVVLWGSKGDRHVDVSQWGLPFGRHDAEEGSIRLSEVVDGDPQGLERSGNDDVDAAATIHQHLLNPAFPNHWIDE
jgi:hypothetical protein